MLHVILNDLSNQKTFPTATHVIQSRPAAADHAKHHTPDDFTA